MISYNTNAVNNLGDRLNFKKFSELEHYVENHHAINHPLFFYIKDCAKKGFTSKQYQIYRDNYFYRTFHTIPSIAFLLASAALNGDTETLVEVGQNLYDEIGEGDASKAHSKLLELSHNTHAKTVFNLAPINLIDIKSHKLIIKEAKQFVENEKDLYTNEIYCITLGAAFAHETAAVTMLMNFYENFFLSYRDYYTNEEFHNVSEYFLAHINGVEQNHAKNAGLAANRFSINQRNLDFLTEGSSRFLNSQSSLWDGIYRELCKAEHESEIIPLKPYNMDSANLGSL